MDMDYRRKKPNVERVLDIITDHATIPEEVIQRKGIPNEINGIKVQNMVNVPGKGYIFYGNHNVQIGQFKYISSTGSYECILNPNAKEVIEQKNAQARKQERKRKLKIQRRNRMIALGLGGLIVISSLSIGIAKGVEAHRAAEQERTRIEQTISISNLSSLPDAVKLKWANYAMNKFQDIADASEYDVRKSQAEDLYRNYFAPIYSSYYSYCELIDSELERELSGDYAERLHEEFERNIELFEERLEILVTNKSLNIGNTPYANARTLDNTPNSEATVYIPISSLPEDTPYNVNNLPDGAEIIDGQIYVPDSCLYETKTITK